MYGPVLDVLRELGGSGTPKEVIPLVTDKFSFTADQLEETTNSGAYRIDNEIRWAVAYLKELDLIDKNFRGVWRLTSQGFNAHLSTEEARSLRSNLRRKRKPKSKQMESENETDDVKLPIDDTEIIIETLKGLSPEGFERFCQALLRSSGFSEVVVTGKSGDGGIDGHGIIQMNNLVSLRVLFQCKRYKESVGPGDIRNFRGSMTGRTDIGIFLTTGRFSRDAQAEAYRDGAPTIELVDGEEIAELMKSLNVGVIPRTVFDVDQEFFDDYR